jgi:signal transduction histidine kinase
LKSPLTSIKGAAELLLDSLQSKSDTLTRMEQKNFISNILGDTGRLEAMTQRLRELARAEAAPPQNEHTELGQVIVGLKSRFPTRAIEATGSLERSIGMSSEKALIVLSHLTDNAIRHNAKRVRLEATDDNGSMTMTVIRYPSRTGKRSSMPSSPRAATLAAREWGSQSSRPS